MSTILFTTNKRQFLDPIGTCCKIILLFFSPPRTKIRIINNNIEITDNNVFESMLIRPIYRDSRVDICVIFPSIVRFIEWYLCVCEEEEREMNPELKNGVNECDDNVSSCCGDDNIVENEAFDPKLCMPSLHTIAKFTRLGLIRLGETYGCDNATFALQYYANLLDDAINGRYSNTLLPTHLSSITNTLLNNNKIRQLWSNKEIEFIADTVDSWNKSLGNANSTMANSYSASMSNFLNAKHNIFLKLVTETNTI